MAWRIDEQVVRGEIDNRERGRVSGRIWLIGREEPVVLELKGDCWRDLAGRRLEFSNPQPKWLGPKGLAVEQKGKVGDITASRKVKVPEIPIEEIADYYEAKKPFPWHWGNSLYLEWFSEINGRVVIESTSFELKIVGEPEWEMSEEEEKRQQLSNEQAMIGFMDTLVEASDEASVEDSDWDSPPQSEEEADQMLHRNDLLVDRIQARMEREGDEANFEEIMKSELERLSEGDSALASEWESGLMETVAPYGSVDEEDDLLFFEHELSERAKDLSKQMILSNRESPWIPENAPQDHPAAYLLESVTKAGAKLAAALNGREWPPLLDECALIIAYLKRARGYLDDALSALQSCQEQRLVEASIMGVVLVEVIDIAKEADEIIEELRERLNVGF